MKHKKVLLIPLLLLIILGSLTFFMHVSRRRVNPFSVLTLSTPPPKTLWVGVVDDPLHIDPLDTWETNSFNVIDQVAEGLFGYNLSDSEAPIIPVLANGFGTWGTIDAEGHINYTVDIKDGVTFHDGSTLNATDVKWTFDRIEYMKDQHLIPAGDLYEYYDPNVNLTKNIINSTYIIDNNTIIFELNSKYGAFERLLTFQSSYILPSEGQIPFDDHIDPYTGDLIGTGPFDYILYQYGVEVKFESYDNYWRGAAHFDELIYKIIPESNERNQALLDGDVHIILKPHEDFYDEFNKTLNNIKIEGSKSSSVIEYLGMNNHLINKTVRKAISYAIDYDYIIEDIHHGYAKRLKSPIPRTIRFFNYSSDVPTLNITKARTIMQSMGYGTGLSLGDDAGWEAATFLSYNYSYNMGNDIREDIFVLLKDNLSAIGIDVIDDGMSFIDWVMNLFDYSGYSRDNLNLWWLGWRPDYADPSNYINQQFTNRSVSYNTAQVNDAQIQLWMEDALLEIDENVREHLYDKIQKRLVEEVFPWAWGVEDLSTTFVAYVENLKEYPINHMQKAYFYPCYLIDNESPTWNNITDQNAELGLEFNYDVNASDLSAIIYSIDDIVNFSIDNETGMLTNNTILSTGDYWVNITAEDAYGNRNSTKIKISVRDTIYPTIDIIFPTIDDKFSEPPPFEVEIKDINLNTTWYSLNSGENITFTENGTIDETEWNSMDNGMITLTFYANDTGENIASENVQIIKDTIEPTINILSPTADEKFSEPPPFIVKINDTHLDSMWYSLNGGENITFTENGTIDQATWDPLSDGTVTLNFYANDSAGNIASENVQIIKDTIAPTVNIISPLYNQAFKNPPSYIVEINDTHLDSMWYTIDGVHNFVFTENGTINQAAWNAQNDGTVIIYFYANDTAENIGRNYVTTIKDTSAPQTGIPGFSVDILLLITLIGLIGLSGLVRRKLNLKPT
ncbi:MAG: hypothetical protein EU548_03125 [Promethearchaeota archaeon]|nr:MAG: hypothetical protein EU548_03125 [Candidatus Lokiarchaeota archaeon]